PSRLYTLCSIILPPPISPLFPYTTLFRSVAVYQPVPKLHHAHAAQDDDPLFLRYLRLPEVEEAIFQRHGALLRPRPVRITREQRSEEHTSELQSRENLVCRLLLEKKNSIT